MFQKLFILKQKNYYPKNILDIGAHHGNWTKSMMNIYPDSKYYLFEGIDYTELNQFNNVSNVMVYKNILLNDKVEEVEWYEGRNTGDSFFKEKTHHYANSIPIKRKTIDLKSIVKMNSLFSNDDNILIKIDCQGAEIPILKGASSILDRTDFIILELPLFGQYNEGVPNFLEHIKYMDSINFVPYDIVDNHYINGFNMQIDMLFINRKHKFNDDVQNSLV